MVRAAAPAPAPSQKRYIVRCSRMAGEYLRGIRERAVDDKGRLRTACRWSTVYSALRACLDELIPRFALDRRFALTEHDGVRLNGIYRDHVGRLVVFWIASSDQNVAIVLFVGYRKDGDANDAYRALARHLRAGSFEGYFKELGQTNPLQSNPAQQPGPG